MADTVASLSERLAEVVKSDALLIGYVMYRQNEMQHPGQGSARHRALFGTTLSSLRQMTGGMWDGNVPCAQKESTSATSATFEPIKALTGTSSLRSESEVGKSAAKAQQVNVYRHTDRCSVTKGSQKYMVP